jgi:hypothetical protein
MSKDKTVECGLCKALVKASGMDGHVAWHDNHPGLWKLVDTETGETLSWDMIVRKEHATRELEGLPDPSITVFGRPKPRKRA